MFRPAGAEFGGMRVCYQHFAPLGRHFIHRIFLENMESNSTQDLIERYFDGDLKEQELAIFHEKLEKDQAFAEAFRLEQELMGGIESYGNERLREQLATIHEEEIRSAEVPGKDGTAAYVPIRRWMWLAAAALIGILVAGRLLMENRKPNPQQLYAMYAVHDFDFTEKSGGDNLLADAERLLKAKDYRQALPVLETYLESRPDDMQAVLAKGIAQMEIGEYESALADFQTVGINNPLLKNEAIWYMALVYLKQNKLAEAIGHLEQIPTNSARWKDAEALAKSLKRLTE